MVPQRQRPQRQRSQPQQQRPQRPQPRQQRPQRPQPQQQRPQQPQPQRHRQWLVIVGLVTGLVVMLAVGSVFAASISQGPDTPVVGDMDTELQPPDVRTAAEPSGDEATSSIPALNAAGRQLDGMKVSVQGEVVGDIIKASDDMFWLALDEGDSSISVLCSPSDAAQIENLGRYGQSGDVVLVFGTFHADCPDHQGLADIHAEHLAVVAHGQPLYHAVDLRLLMLSGLLLVIGAALMLMRWRLMEQTR